MSRRPAAHNELGSGHDCSAPGFRYFTGVNHSAPLGLTALPGPHSASPQLVLGPASVQPSPPSLHTPLSTSPTCPGAHASAWP